MNITRSLIIALIFTILFSLPDNAQAQERVTIEDPEFAFSYEKPDEWVSVDTPLYHYVRKLSKEDPSQTYGQVSITYYDGACRNLNECFEAQEKGAIPAEVMKFEKISDGEETIDNARARWLKFYGAIDPESPDLLATNYVYFFIKFDQFFVVKIILPGRNAATELEALSVVRSIEVSML